MEVKITCDSPEVKVPGYGNPGDAGMDVRANISEPITLNPLERAIIPTGIRVAIPEGYEIQVRPRSGLAAKYGVTVCNTPGTIEEKKFGIIKYNL